MKNSPWGLVQGVKEIAPGIHSISIASHGGIALNEARWAELVATFPFVQPWAGTGWLEEDCDAGYAILRWPEYFSSSAVYHTVCQVRAMADSGQWKTLFEWLRSEHPLAMKLTGIYEKELKKIDGLWQTGSACTDVNGWSVHMTQVGTGEERWVKFPSYPAKSLYRTEELP